MPRGFDFTTIKCEVLKLRDASFLIRINGEERFVPRRVCLDSDGVDEGDTDLIVADWWLKKEGLD